MSAMTVELNGEIVEELRRLAAAQERSETDIVREAPERLPTRCSTAPQGNGTISQWATRRLGACTRPLAASGEG